MHAPSPITPRLTIETTPAGIQHVTVRVRNAAERAAGLQLLRKALPGLTEVDRLVRRAAQVG